MPNALPYSVPEDEWFIRNRVKPPERTAFITDEEREHLLAQNNQDHVHEWHQRGNELYCDATTMQHGQRVATDVMLKGTDPQTGNPILAKFDVKHNN